MPKRKHQKFNRPKKLFDKAIIDEEKGLIKKYGLKTRREVWRADYAIGRIRRIAKSLITANEKEKTEFLERQKEKGFPVNSLAEILGLNKEDYLKRRLQSIIVKKGFAKTHKQARQFIIHKHVSIKDNIIDSPSHLTTLKEELNLTTNLALPEKKEITNEEKNILEKMKPKEEK